MQWIYLSPHLDDAVLSCGGLIWEQAQAGEQVSIWTLCSADPPHTKLSPLAEALHARWERGPEASAARRMEDIAACARIGADYRHLDLRDCIYRRDPDGQTFLYTTDEAIMGEIHPLEAGLAKQLGGQMAGGLPAEAQVVCPLSVGGHVDHRLMRAAAEYLVRPLWYYADYPYVARRPEQIEALLPPGWGAVKNTLSEAGLRAWQRGVAAYASQISTFWEDRAAMEAAIRAYHRNGGGQTLWGPPGGDISLTCISRKFMLK